MDPVSETNGDGRGASKAAVGPLTFSAVLLEAGPHVSEAPDTDADVFARLGRCGELAWRLPATLRVAMEEYWVEYLKERRLLGITQPYRIVREAFAEGRLRAGVDTHDEWLTHAQLQAIPTPEELVRGHLPAGGLALLYGPRGIGKTFFALDLALSIDAGINYHGYAVRQGPVAYILAEGRGGLTRRVAAWLEERGRRETGARFLCRSVRLLDPTDVDRLVAQLASWSTPPALVVVDTMARCLVPGDENSTADMSGAVAALDRIGEATGALRLVVHHTGHDKTRERGSTALGAAADTVMAVSKDADVLTLQCEKQRDAVEFQPIRFRLHPVGQSVTPVRVLGAGSGLSDAERQVLEVLVEACAGNELVPSGKWHTLADVPHRTFHRARKRLLDMALVEPVENGRYIRYRPRVSDNEPT